MALMFGLIVVGSVVRATGSGLACPDWPLCEGRLLPRLEPHVLTEWIHRLIALLVSVLLFATVAWTLAHRELRARLGGLAAFAFVLLVVQVLLGALTVWKLLSPSMVSGHLAAGLVLFSTLLTISLAASAEAEADGRSIAGVRPPGLLALCGLSTLLVLVQAVLGGVVSSSHAGLACPDWPTCNGVWLPPMRGMVGLHMMHRLGGYTAALSVLVMAVASRGAPDPRVWAGARMALTLVLTQVVLGVCNVLLGAPVWLSALHLATATAVLGLLVATTYRVASLPARAPALAAVAETAR